MNNESCDPKHCSYRFEISEDAILIFRSLNPEQGYPYEFSASLPATKENLEKCNNLLWNKE